MCRNNSFETLVLFLSASSFAVKICRKGKMLKGRLMTVWKNHPGSCLTGTKLERRIFVSMIFCQLVSFPSLDQKAVTLSGWSLQNG